jgi:hypothetical protein
LISELKEIEHGFDQCYKEKPMDCKRDSRTTHVDLQRFDAAATQEALDLKSFKIRRCFLLDWKMIGNCERKEAWKNLIHCGIDILSLRNLRNLIDVFVTEESISNVWCVARE